MLNITIQSCATKALQVCYKSKPLEDYFCAGFCAEILARVQESIGTSNAVRKTKSQDKVAFWRLLTSSRQSRPQASKRRKRHQASHGNGSASNTTSAPQLAASGKPQLVHVLARIAREETSCNEEVPELDQLPIAKMRKEFAPREEPGS